MAAFKRMCPLCWRVRNEDLHTICGDCLEEGMALHQTYKRIIIARPHLQRSSMSEVFEQMWVAFQSLEAERDRLLEAHRAEPAR